MDVPLAPKPFVWDGCSGLMSALWRRLFKHGPPWEYFCAEHDWAYHHGGPDYLKDHADNVLRASVKSLGPDVKYMRFALWASAMHAAVHTGGVWWLPYMGARWGKGYEYPEHGPESYHSPDGSLWKTPPFPYTRETLPKLRDEISGKEVNA